MNKSNGVLNRTIRVDLDLWLRAKNQAGREQRPVSELICDLLRDYLAQTSPSTDEAA